MSEELTLVFRANSTDAVSCAEAFMRAVDGTEWERAYYKLYGKLARGDQVARSITAHRWTAFHMVRGVYEAHYNSLPRFDVDVLSITLARNSVPDADGLVRSLCGQGQLVLGALVDSHYDHWQNVDTVSEYESAGREHKHLPKISNGLPPPLAESIIDIARNPGRRTLREGYIEIVASKMWLGDSFFRIVGVDAATVLKQLNDRLHCQVLSGPDYTELRCGDDLFRSAETPEAAMQVELRQVLYPHSSHSA